MGDYNDTKVTFSCKKKIKKQKKLTGIMITFAT
jgi:hypothetical protein